MSGLTVRSNVSLAIRTLRHRPVYALLSVLLLALGVAAVSAIATVADIALLKPLPYTDATRLRWLRALEPIAKDSSVDYSLAPAQFVRWRAEARAFDVIHGVSPRPATVNRGGEPEALDAMYVTAGIYATLGGAPVRGREFTRDEERAGSGVAMLSYEYWHNALADDPGVVGRSVTVDGTPRTVIGVLPKGFRVLFATADVALPLSLDQTAMTNRSRVILTIGRLRPGASDRQAAQELDRINDIIATEIPLFKRTRARVQDLRTALFGATRASLVVMLGAVLLLMVLAVANLMNLWLSDAVSRRHGTATRLALGAGPARILGARVSEALLIIVTAAILGLALGRVALNVLRVTHEGFFTGFGEIGYTLRTVTFILGLALVAGLAAALPVALAESRLDVRAIASAAAKSVGNTADKRWRNLLLAVQVSIALVLLSAASLLAKNLRDLDARPAGFDASNVLAVKMTVPPRLATMGERAAYVQRMVDVLAQLPGVDAASAAQSHFTLGSSSQSFFAIAGVVADDSTGFIANIRHVMPAYFDVFRVRVDDGRVVDATDVETSRPVAVVNRAYAKRFLSGRVVGARIRRTTRSEFPWMEVVGVVDDVRDAGVGIDLGPTVYVPYLQENNPPVGLTFIARLRAGVVLRERSVKEAIWRVDASQAITRVVPVEVLLTESSGQPRFRLLVVALLGVGALVLVLVGIYSLTLVSVLQRTREFGVRAALGERPRSLMLGAMRHGLQPVVIGIAAGMLVSVPALRFMQRFVGQSPAATDAFPVLGVLVLFACAAGLATVFPARRAAGIDPALAMRVE